MVLNLVGKSFFCVLVMIKLVKVELLLLFVWMGFSVMEASGCLMLLKLECFDRILLTLLLWNVSKWNFNDLYGDARLFAKIFLFVSFGMNEFWFDLFFKSHYCFFILKHGNRKNPIINATFHQKSPPPLTYWVKIK